MVDAVRQGLDVARFDARHRGDAHLVTAELAVPRRVEDPVLSQDGNNRV